MGLNHIDEGGEHERVVLLPVKEYPISIMVKPFKSMYNNLSHPFKLNTCFFFLANVSFLFYKYSLFIILFFFFSDDM